MRAQDVTTLPLDLKAQARKRSAALSQPIAEPRRLEPNSIDSWLELVVHLTLTMKSQADRRRRRARRIRLCNRSDAIKISKLLISSKPFSIQGSLIRTTPSARGGTLTSRRALASQTTLASARVSSRPTARREPAKIQKLLPI